MTKKDIKKLVLASYTNNTLNKKRVDRITKHLTRSELKNYIKYLKLNEKSKNVVVEVSSLSNKEQIIKDIKKNYPDKNISVVENKEIIAGIKITNNDIIYDANLKNRLENLVTFMNI